MFLGKKASKPTKTTLKLPLKFQFGVTSEDLRGSYNVEKIGNGLKTLYIRGIVTFPSPARYIVGYHNNLVYVMTDSGLCCMSDFSNEIFLGKYGADVCSCVYRDDLIVSGKDYGTYLVKDSEATSLYGDGFSSVVACADRIFGLHKNQVSYTAAGKVDGWEQGQTVTLPSECQALACIGNKVYALGNNCYMLVPDGSDIEFKVVPLAKNVGAAAKRSVINYRDTVVFATVNGLYRLSNDRLTPICEQLNDVAQLGLGAGVLFQNKYYLACVSRDNGDYFNDVVVCIDIDDEQLVGMLRTSTDSLAVTSKKIVTAGIGICNTFSSGVSTGKYQLSNVDFANSDKKFLDKLVIKTGTNLDVTIRSETETRLYKLKGKIYPQKLFLRDMGWKFSIDLYSDDGLDVQDATLYAHTCREV